MGSLGRTDLTDGVATSVARSGGAAPVAGDVAGAVATSRSLHKLDEKGLTLAQRKAKVLRAIKAVSSLKERL